MASISFKNLTEQTIENDLLKGYLLFLDEKNVTKKLSIEAVVGDEDNYITEENLEEKLEELGVIMSQDDLNLSDFAKKAELKIEPVTGSDDKKKVTLGEGKSAEFLTAHQSLTNYALKSELPTDFYSKEEVDSKVSAVDAKIPTDFYKKSEVDNAIAAAKSELIGGAGEDYDTLKEIEEWVEDHQELYQALVTGLATKATANDLTFSQGSSLDKRTINLGSGKSEEFLVAHQSLAEYAKSEDVAEDIADLKDEILGGKDSVEELLQELMNSTDIDLSKYVKKAEVNIEAVEGASDKKKVTLGEGKTAEFITAHQSLTNYALKSELPTLEEGTLTIGEESITPLEVDDTAEDGQVLTWDGDAPIWKTPEKVTISDKALEALTDDTDVVISSKQLKDLYTIVKALKDKVDTYPDYASFSGGSTYGLKQGADSKLAPEEIAASGEKIFTVNTGTV